MLGRSLLVVGLSMVCAAALSIVASSALGESPPGVSELRTTPAVLEALPPQAPADPVVVWWLNDQALVCAAIGVPYPAPVWTPELLGGESEAGPLGDCIGAWWGWRPFITTDRVTTANDG